MILYSYINNFDKITIERSFNASLSGRMLKAGRELGAVKEVERCNSNKHNSVDNTF